MVSSATFVCRFYKTHQPSERSFPTVVLHLLRNEWIEKNPFQYYKLKEEHNKAKDHLTKDELDKLLAKPMPNVRLERIRALAFRLDSPTAGQIRRCIVRRVVAEIGKPALPIFLNYGTGAVTN